MQPSTYPECKQPILQLTGAITRKIDGELVYVQLEPSEVWSEGQAYMSGEAKGIDFKKKSFEKLGAVAGYVCICSVVMVLQEFD